MSKFRRRLMGLTQLREAKRKDFVRVEYIENTSTAYIDTKLFTVYNDGRTYKHIVNLSYTVTNERQLNGANGNGYFGINKNGKFECAYIQDSAIAAGDSWHNINFSYISPTNTSLNIKYEIDNQLLKKNLKVTLYNYPHSIYIFAIGGRSAAAPLFFCKERIKSYQIYIDDVLVRDYIPMYQISTDTYGLWDRVTEEFYTSPNGVKFTGGREIIYDAEIEYLQSTGTQYIQLDCNVTKTNKFSVGGVVIPIYTSDRGDYAVFSANPWAQFIGAFYSKNNNNVITYSSVIGGLGAAGGVGGGWGGTVGTEVSFELSTTEKVINGVHTSISRPLQNAITAFRIFGGYRDNHRYPIKIKSLYIKKENEILYDFIPVRVGNVGYMYDKVSGKLFGNDGSGSFILGQDTVVYDKI